MLTGHEGDRELERNQRCTARARRSEIGGKKSDEAVFFGRKKLLFAAATRNSLPVSLRLVAISQRVQNALKKKIGRDLRKTALFLFRPNRRAAWSTMSDDTSFDEYDDGLDYSEIISQLDQQLESAPKKLLPAALTKPKLPPPVPIAGPSSQVNVKLPTKLAPRATGPARIPPPPMRRAVVPPATRKLPPKSFEKQPYVPANPFLNRAAPPAPAIGSTTAARKQCDNSAMLEIGDVEMDLDDTPDIQVAFDEGGGYVQARRSSNEMMPPPLVRAAPKKAGPIVETKGKENASNSLSSMERKELDALRRQLDDVRPSYRSAGAISKQSCAVSNEQGETRSRLQGSQGSSHDEEW